MKIAVTVAMYCSESIIFWRAPRKHGDDDPRRNEWLISTQVSNYSKISRMMTTSWGKMRLSSARVSNARGIYDDSCDNCGVMRLPFCDFSPCSHAHLPVVRACAVPVRMYFTVPASSARATIVFPPHSRAQYRSPGIYFAILYHDPLYMIGFVRELACTNVAGIKARPAIKRFTHPSRVAIVEAQPERVDSGWRSRHVFEDFRRRIVLVEYDWYYFQ